MMMYLRALPRVWPSSRNSKEAAVGVEPGSYRNAMLEFPHFSTCSSGGCRPYQEQFVFLQFKLVCGLLAVLRLLRVVHDGIVSNIGRHRCCGVPELP